MKPYAIWLGIPLFLCACCKGFLTVQTDYITVRDLASYFVNTPDPRQNCPSVGQRLIVSWSLPKYFLCYENLRLEITIRFKNHEEVLEVIHLSKNRGTYVFTLLNEDYFSKEGILTYKVDLLGKDLVLEEWRHQIWTDLILLQDGEDMESNSKEKADDVQEVNETDTDEYPIDWSDQPI